MSSRALAAPRSPPGHARRYEEAEVAGLLVQAVDDRLIVEADVVHALVEIGDPVERLLRRGDVVAPGGEHDDGRADVAQIDAVLAVEGLDLARGQLVADEEVLDDPLHLLLVHEVVAAPPLLELEETRRLRVDLRVEVVELGPVGVRRDRGSRSCSRCGRRRTCRDRGRRPARPSSCRPAARPVAHRVLARDAGPVGQRRAGQQDGPDLVRGQRGQHHQRPPALAVADQERAPSACG